MQDQNMKTNIVAKFDFTICLRFLYYLIIFGVIQGTDIQKKINEPKKIKGPQNVWTPSE